MKKLSKKIAIGTMAASVTLGAGLVTNIQSSFAATSTNASATHFWGSSAYGTFSSYATNNPYTQYDIDIVDLTADILDVDADDITAALKDGQTLVEIAEDNDVTEASYLKQLKAAVEDAIDDLVDDGTLTETKADSLLEDLSDKLETIINSTNYADYQYNKDFNNALLGNSNFDLIALTADILDIDEDDVTAALEDGQTLVEIAEDNGVTEASYLKQLVAATEDIIDDLVDDGTLTESQADELTTNLSEQLEKVIEGTFGSNVFGGGFGSQNQSSPSGQQGQTGASKPNGNTSNQGGNSSNKTNLTDITGHWASQYINDLVSKGIITGDDNNKFNPGSQVTREQLATMISKGFNLNSSTTTSTSEKSSFSDVSDSRWSKQYVQSTQKYFETNKDSNGNQQFSPTESSTRLDVVVTLIKALMDSDDSIKLLDLDDAQDLLKDKFKDAGSIPSKYAQYVATAVDNDLISGDTYGKFNPNNTITRAEIAKILDLALSAAAENN